MSAPIEQPSQSTDDTTGNGVENDQSQNEGGTQQETKNEAGKTFSQAEYDALHARMQAADRRASQLEADKQAAEDAKKDEVTRVKDENTRLVEKNKGLEEEMKTILLKNAFLTAGGSWHDPADAYEVLLRNYPDAVKIDDNREVKGMKDAVEKLAKEKAYLVKPAEEKKDDTSSAATGPLNNGRRKGEDKTVADKDAIARRFPAMASRR